MSKTDNSMSVSNYMFGREQIFTVTEEITIDNVIDEVNLALATHAKNCAEIDYLHWYRRGKQPILSRKKEVRPEINNRVVENHAKEIVQFRNGYFLTQPACYISRKKSKASKVEKLNEYLYTSGKQQVDNEIVDWFHTVGVGTLLISPYDDVEKPVQVYTLDPRSAFVVYSRRPGNEPVMGLSMVAVSNTEVAIDVFTRENVFRIKGTGIGSTLTGGTLAAQATEIKKVEKNHLCDIPIIEYKYDTCNMGAFEPVIPLLDAINNLESNRLDGVEQFIQSLVVAINCNFEEGTTANTIREAGMVVLKSIAENKAEFKILSEQLDQSQTQVLKDSLYQQVLTICGMPSTTKGGTSTSDTGAAVLYRDGWYQADTVAKDTEDLFKKSNRRFDNIFIDIINRKTDLGISINDFELQFVRNETANLLVKTQGALNLKQLGLSPEITLAKSGVSNDPVADVANSKEYIERAWNPQQMVSKPKADDKDDGKRDEVD